MLRGDGLSTSLPWLPPFQRLNDSFPPESVSGTRDSSVSRRTGVSPCLGPCTVWYLVNLVRTCILYAKLQNGINGTYRFHQCFLFPLSISSRGTRSTRTSGCAAAKKQDGRDGGLTRHVVCSSGGLWQSGKLSLPDWPMPVQALRDTSPMILCGVRSKWLDLPL